MISEMRLQGSNQEKQQHTRMKSKIQRYRDKIDRMEVLTEMVPKMPPLIPLFAGDKLKMNILDKIKLVAKMENTLLREQKKLQQLWKEKHRRKIKKLPEKKQEQVKVRNSIQVPVIFPLVKKNINSDMENVIKDKEEVNQFRHFWSFYESFRDEDDSDDLTEDKNPLSIDDLVVEEVLKYRARSEHLDDESCSELS